MTFSEDLLRFGPGTSVRVSRDEAVAYCARLTATHYENFSVVTWLTPREHRPAFQSIYAFCRWSDDLGDEVGDPQRSLELLAWWRGELRAMFRGDATHPVMIALAETVKRQGIPAAPFEALISAFEQDQRVSEYQTYEQLLDYCTRSANPVGHLVLYVAGAFSPENARLADMTCTALQLANFWQDVARDLAIGRVYLPREDRARFGYIDDDLRALRFSPAFAELLEFEVARARELLSLGRALIPRIPGPLAVDVDLFSRGGSAILDRIEARGFDVLSSRPVLTKWTKLRLLGRANRIHYDCQAPRSLARDGGDRPRAKSAFGGRYRALANGEFAMKMDRALRDSYQFCGVLARREARNFYYAFLLLPGARRRSMCALYAFLRHTDDLVDHPAATLDKARALDAWRLELGSALAGRATVWPGFPALANTVARHSIPADLLEKAIDGVSMDVEPRRFVTFDELADYCYHVASVVGLSCLHIWGYRSEGGKAERLAESCGIALQLTNIIRDVHEDARNGRIYLPEEDLARFGVEPSELIQVGKPSDRVRALLAFEGNRAYEYYAQASPLTPLVNRVGRPVLQTIVGIYRALLDEIARRDYHVLDGRISLPAWYKVAVALRAMANRINDD